MDGERFVNELHACSRRLSPDRAARRAEPMNFSSTGWHAGEQPLARQSHRHREMLRSSLLLLFAAAAAPHWLSAQGSAAAPASAPVSATVQPALSQVSSALQAADIRRWKAPNPVRDAASEDVSSIQRDMSSTLAALLQQADAAPGSDPAAFAVYRNVDALYDTLLRVVETAELAAPENEEASLESALKNLETARASLGDAILSGSQTQQAELIHLRSAVAAGVGARSAAPVNTVVVDDGPAHTATHRRTTTPAKKPSTTASQPAKATPAPANPAAATNPQ
jgi:hypothetical protein